MYRSADGEVVDGLEAVGEVEVTVDVVVEEVADAGGVEAGGVGVALTTRPRELPTASGRVPLAARSGDNRSAGVSSTREPAPAPVSGLWARPTASTREPGAVSG